MKRKKQSIAARSAASRKAWRMRKKMVQARKDDEKFLRDDYEKFIASLYHDLDESVMSALPNPFLEINK